MRFDSNADLLSDTGGLVDIQGGTWTCLCWVRRIADRNDWTGAWSFHLNTTHFVYLESTTGGGDNLAVWVGGSGGESSIGNVDISDNGWHFVAVTMNGSTVTIYDRAPGDTVLNSASGTPGSPGAAATAFYINDTPWGNEWINGRINAIKVWTRVLTVAELLQEANFYMPVDPTSILRVHPLMHADDDEVDYSGNGHTLTVAGTPVTEDGPPIMWAPFLLNTGIAASTSGTLFLQSVNGALSFAGALTTVVAFKHSIAGVLSFGGALTRASRVSQNSALSFIGGLEKLTSVSQEGSLTFAGALSKEAQKLLTGALDFAGETGTIVVFTQSADGVLTFAGSFTKNIFKAADGTLTFSGDIAKQINKELLGTLSFTGAINRLVNKSLSGQLSFTGNLIAGVLFSQAVIGALNFVGGLATLFIPAGTGPTLRTMWRSVWSRVWKDPGTKDEDT